MSSSPQSLTLPSGEQLPYTIDKRDVEHPRITLNPNGTLAVVAPPDTPSQTLVSQEKEWIAREYHSQQAKLSAVRQQYGPLENGLTLWGKRHAVIEQVGQYNLDIDGAIYVTTPESASTTQYLHNQVRNALSVAVKTIAADYCDQLNTGYENLNI